MRAAHRPQFRRSAPRPYGGYVYVSAGRDRVDGAEFFVVSYEQPNGGVWRSSPITLRDHADAAARAIGEFTCAVVRQ